MKEEKPSKAVRYLGVMVAADRNSREQTMKVDKLVRGVIDKIRQSKCLGGIANYLIRTGMCGRHTELPCPIYQNHNGTATSMG